MALVCLAAFSLIRLVNSTYADARLVANNGGTDASLYPVPRSILDVLETPTANPAVFELPPINSLEWSNLPRF